ncbi:Wadjet anti-phage system protein JetD domain-containing protein [Demequina pelophila]|uniref:Wadjet anti-phage system protein JetD domain-containing protein n=1 Tax=Demequina pelophila TaxID=1638984 RepID=UPI0009E4AACC|nr:DUF3322 and DUF2220 domain-containing protein [Demequina pelophila]
MSGSPGAARAVTPEDLATRASSLYKREARGWAADPDAAVAAELSLPLRPPTERTVLSDLDGALAWVARWREAEAMGLATVTWVTRRWISVGAQSVPERATAAGADAIAAVAGLATEWATMRDRCAALRAALLPTAGWPDAVVTALRRHAGAIAGLEARDFDVLAGVVTWLAAHPVSGRHIRELPIRGIDTKWLEAHRAVVEGLVAAVTGREGLGLKQAPVRVRLRALDPDLACGGLRDITAPVDELAGLACRPRAVLVTENLASLLALPDMPGVIGAHGAGYAVDALAGLPWVRGARVLYWGDLDSHGFAILNRARAAGLDAESVLMDAATLAEHRDLWVPEPRPSTATLAHLTPGEREALEALESEGYPRLEQERVPWETALAALREAVGE